MKVLNKLSPNDEQLNGFMEGDVETPIAMLNLLKFKEKAEYEDGRDTNLSGVEASTPDRLVSLPSSYSAFSLNLRRFSIAIGVSTSPSMKPLSCSSFGDNLFKTFILLFPVRISFF